MDSIAVTVYQHAAILTCRVHDQAQAGDQFYDNYYRSTFVWIEEQGVWRCWANDRNFASRLKAYIKLPVLTFCKFKTPC